MNPQSGDQLAISSLSLYQWAIIPVLLLFSCIFALSQHLQDFPAGPAVKALVSTAAGMGLVLGQENN